MVDFECKPRYDIQDLLRIMELLRSPDGCPWDRAQTHQSIRRNFLEEAYEAVEAIDEGSPEHLKEELGDVLLQVVFHALMEQEAGRFDLDGGSVPHRILSGVLSVFERLRKMSFPGCRKVFVRGEKKHAGGFSCRHRL